MKYRSVFIYRAEFLCKSTMRGRTEGKMQLFGHGKHEKGVCVSA